MIEPFVSAIQLFKSLGEGKVATQLRVGIVVADDAVHVIVSAQILDDAESMIAIICVNLSSLLVEVDTDGRTIIAISFDVLIESNDCFLALLNALL